ncbi:YadA family autotransporter adhesin, partial [Acinetobacter sp. c1-l78]|uniref:YadA family autotransporter adhesin n=1 Tax=Acinetobacter sp. c1-l78 TaxID=3342803 RepID=UPI0035B7E2E4
PVAPADAGKFVTAGDIANAINNSGFNATSGKTTGSVSGTTNELVNPGETLTFQAGDNMVLTQTGNIFNYGVSKNPVFDSVTAGPVKIDAAGINAGGKTISNLAPGVNPTDAATVGQLPEVKAGTGASVAESTGTNGQKVYTVSATGVAAPTTNLTTTPDGKVAEPAAGTETGLTNAQTVTNAINKAGFKVAQNGVAQPDLVNAGDTVDFVNGNLTTAKVTTTPTGAQVSYDVNAQAVTNASQLPVVYTDAAGNKLVKDPVSGNFYPANADGTPNKTLPEVPADQVTASMNSGGNTTVNSPTTLGNVKSTLPTTYSSTKDSAGNAVTPTVEQPLPNLTATQLNNAATVGDVLNAGFNLQNNGTARDFVKPYDTVNFVNGKGTVANVTTSADGKNNDVKVNVDYSNLTVNVGGNKVAIVDNGDGTFTYNLPAAGGNGGSGINVNGGTTNAGTTTPTGTGTTLINGQGTSVSVNPTTGVIKVDSPLAYKNNVNTADTSTPTDTVNLVGAKPVQMNNLASGVRTNGAEPAVGVARAQAIKTASGDALNNAANIGDIQSAAKAATAEVKSSDNSVSVDTTYGANGQPIYDVKVNTAGLINQINQQLGDVAEDARAGTSAAMAMASLPQAYIPGKSMLTGGISTYRGQGAIAVGLSKLSDNGRWVLKLSGTADTKGNAGAAAGAGFHF